MTDHFSRRQAALKAWETRRKPGYKPPKVKHKQPAKLSQVMLRVVQWLAAKPQHRLTMQRTEGANSYASSVAFLNKDGSQGFVGYSRPKANRQTIEALLARSLIVLDRSSASGRSTSYRLVNGKFEIEREYNIYTDYYILTDKGREAANGSR